MLKYSQEGIDLEVEVTVNGHLMKGHNATRDSNVITQYIEASAGTDFEVEYSIIGLNTTNKDVRVSCYVDVGPAQVTPSNKAITLPRSIATYSYTPSAPEPHAPPQQPREAASLRRKDTLFLLKDYRGNIDGLEHYSNEHLDILVKRYREDHQKEKSADAEQEVRVKREQNDGEDAAVVDGYKKKKASELMEIDN
ncbi:hypothetical protein IQ06DRAFT_352304 [Phaeosphaeriaceae sp. SRC1lsM3a]|nr:hypothetical protein IQ06DRAFT_352304 [Stagonospora sp. SRC1lsM3a]